MTGTRAEILSSYVEYLNELDHRFGVLLRTNRAVTVQTEIHIADSFAQLAGGEHASAKHRPKFVRTNNAFIRKRLSSPRP